MTVQPQSAQSNSPGVSPRTEGWWKFGDDLTAGVEDLSGNGHTLTTTGEPTRVEGPFGGGVALDGATQWLGTAKPVLRTDASFSVAAWVRLDGDTVQPPPGEFAWTALSQSGASHTPFYLGLRVIQQPQPDGTTVGVPSWCFTAAPVDGSMTGAVEWQHAHSTQPADESQLGQWVLLVGVLDAARHTATLYVPSTGDRNTVQLTAQWPYWNADGGLQVGFGRYLDDVSDQWPGSVGPVRVFSGVLSESDAAALHTDDKLPDA